MKPLSELLLIASLLATMLTPLQAVAQNSADMATGEIRKIDKEAGKVTIRHGTIKSIDMPPMTMVFVVKNPALLDTLKQGDKVNFDVIQEDGKLVVTDLQAAKP
jgi:Cu(I)/Ag(I) efflux system protein CusF